MSFMQFQLNLLFFVPIHGLSLMKVINTYFVDHRFTWVTKTIHNVHDILVGLTLFTLHQNMTSMNNPM
jgi:hypothetical protein